jgi:hypothetical protein
VTRNTTELELETGARCCAVPGSERERSGQNLPSRLIIDEASRINDSLISAVTPMMAITDGDLIALTTPFGKRGWFFEQWRTGEGYQRVKKTAADCQRISQAFLEKERKRLGPLMYAQEYECEFIDPGASAFSTELIDACLSHDFEQFP